MKVAPSQQSSYVNVRIRSIQGLATQGQIYWRISMGMNKQRSRTQAGAIANFSEEIFRFDLGHAQGQELLEFILVEDFGSMNENKHFHAQVDMNSLRMSPQLMNFPV